VFFVLGQYPVYRLDPLSIGRARQTRPAFRAFQDGRSDVSALDIIKRPIATDERNRRFILIVRIKPRSPIMA
jgi:hypothetical protein